MPTFLRPAEAAVAVFGKESKINGRALHRAAIDNEIQHYWIRGKLHLTIEDVETWARTPRPAPRTRHAARSIKPADDICAAQARAAAAISALRRG